MKESKFVIEQLDEALEERQGLDRRRADVGSDPDSGENRRQGDRRERAEQNKS